MKTEVAIIGAGPAGLIAARELARGGVTVKVFEEHSEVGEPDHCAGILSIEGLKRLGIKPNTDFIQQEIVGGTLYSPSGINIRITNNRPRAYIVNRGAFDRHLADMMLDEGAELKTGYRVKELLVREGKVSGLIHDDEVKAELVINAEGVKGTLSRSLGFSKPEGVLSGINAEVSDVELEEGMVEVWFGDQFSPGFFVWVVPTGDNTARCGLGCSSGNPWVRLRGFLDKRFKDYDTMTPARWSIITGGPINKTYGEGILLIGDVAGQVKPTTAGGVIMGGLCAVEAAKTTFKALDSGDTSLGQLKLYDDAWRAKLGKEFTTMLQARRIANKISDARMDRLFDAAKKAGLEKTAENLINEGDMDMQSRIIRKAITNPRIIQVGVSALGRILYNELLALLG